MCVGVGSITNVTAEIHLFPTPPPPVTGENRNNGKLHIFDIVS